MTEVAEHTSTPSVNAGDRPNGGSGRSLRRNFIWAFFGNAIYGACQWAAIAMLARLSRPEHLGVYALGVAICSPIFMFTNLNLREIQSTDARREFRFAQYFLFRLGSVLVTIGAIALGVFVSGYKGETGVVVILVAVWRGIEYLADAVYGMLQRHERMERISKSLILHGGLCVAGLCVGLLATGSLTWGVTAAAFGAGVAFLYDLRGPRVVGEVWRDPWGKLKDVLQFAELRRLILLGFPLGFAAMLISFTINVPRYFIERSWGARELGIFAAMAYAMQVGTTFVVALGQSASARLARYAASGNWKEFGRLLWKLVGIAVALGAAGMAVSLAAGGPLLRMLYGQEYAQRSDILVWLMAAAAASYVAGILGFAIISLRQLNILIPTFLFAALVCLGLSFLLVPRMGLVGAAVATLGAAVTQMIASCAIVYRGMHPQGARIGQTAADTLPGTLAPGDCEL